MLVQSQYLENSHVTPILPERAGKAFSPRVIEIRRAVGTMESGSETLQLNPRICTLNGKNFSIVATNVTAPADLGVS